jgi:hypothetical protein
MSSHIDSSLADCSILKLEVTGSHKNYTASHPIVTAVKLDSILPLRKRKRKKWGVVVTNYISDF